MFSSLDPLYQIVFVSLKFAPDRWPFRYRTGCRTAHATLVRAITVTAAKATEVKATQK